MQARDKDKYYARSAKSDLVRVEQDTMKIRLLSQLNMGPECELLTSPVLRSIVPFLFVHTVNARCK